MHIGRLLSFSLYSLRQPNAFAETADQVIDLQLRWHHQFQFAGYYAAVEKGFYKQEGLDVRLHAGDRLTSQFRKFVRTMSICRGQ